MLRRLFCVAVLVGYLVPAVQVVMAGDDALPLQERSPASRSQPAPTPLVPADEAPLNPALVTLRERVRQALDTYYVRPLNSRDDSPWSVLHWAIAYGVDAQVAVGGPDGERANAIGWLCVNRHTAGQRLLYRSEGQLYLPIAPGLQGHQGQFLSMLAQARVKDDYPLQVDGQKLTVADLVKQEQLTCQTRIELTFKLIGLSHYLPSNARWVDFQGETWDIPRLISEELQQPIVRGACCGGTHRLIGLSYAARKRESRGEPLDGQWLRARKYVTDYQNYALSLQNPDGSFSTAWFLASDHRGDAARRLETTGHILEWLVLSLPTERLQDPKVTLAVQYLADLLLENRGWDWNNGPLGHGLHALALYEERVFHARPGDRGTRLAAR